MLKDVRKKKGFLEFATLALNDIESKKKFLGFFFGKAFDVTALSRSGIEYYLR